MVWVVLVLQVAIDQILWNPIFGTMFFTYMGLAEGQDLEGIKTRLKNDLLTSVSTAVRQAAQERSTAGAPCLCLQLLLSFGTRLTRAVPAAVCPLRLTGEGLVDGVARGSRHQLPLHPQLPAPALHQHGAGRRTGRQGGTDEGGFVVREGPAVVVDPDGVVQVFYNCFLSLLANKGAKKDEPVAVAAKK